MKDIVIIANFCDYETSNGNNRFNYIANILHEQGNSVELVTSSFSHRRKIQRKKRIDERYKIVLISEPGYKKNISLKRFYSHYKWGHNLVSYLKGRKKPDVVYCAVPSLTGPYKVARYCKKNNIKFIIDVQDLWPEAFQMIFNPPIVGSIIYKPFKIIANKIYSSADGIIAVSKTYANRAKKVNQQANAHSVFLGTNLEIFDRNVNKYKIKKDRKLMLGYCGTLGSSYDLMCVIDALKILKDRNNSVPKFVIMGDGPLKEKFEKYAKKENIDCDFTGILPYDMMCAKLASCDIAINPISRGAAQSIINKHADYAAAGIPVINTQECEEYKELVNNYQMGFNSKNNNCYDLANKIEKLIINVDLRKEMGLNARKCAEEKFDRKYTYEEIMSVINE